MMNLYLFTREQSQSTHQRVWQEHVPSADDPITNALASTETIDEGARADEMGHVSNEEAADTAAAGSPEDILDELEEEAEYQLNADEQAADAHLDANHTVGEPAPFVAGVETAGAGAAVDVASGAVQDAPETNDDAGTDNRNEDGNQPQPEPTPAPAAAPEETDWNTENITDRIPVISKANIDEIAWLEWAGDQIPESLKSNIHDDWVDHLRKNAGALKGHGQEEMAAEAKAYIEKNVDQEDIRMAKMMYPIKKFLKMISAFLPGGAAIAAWAKSETETDEALEEAREKIENPVVPGEEGAEEVAGTSTETTEATALQETETKVAALYTEKGIEGGKVTGVTNANEYEQLSKLMNDNPDFDKKWYKAGLELATLKKIAEHKEDFEIKKSSDDSFIATKSRDWRTRIALAWSFGSFSSVSEYDLSKPGEMASFTKIVSKLDSGQETNNVPTA